MGANGRFPNTSPIPCRHCENVTLHPTHVESDEFHSTIEGKLEITLDADAVGMVGAIDAQAGDLDLFDRRYRVEQAAVRFDGTVDPLVSVNRP